VPRGYHIGRIELQVRVRFVPSTAHQGPGSQTEVRMSKFNQIRVWRLFSAAGIASLTGVVPPAFAGGSNLEQAKIIIEHDVTEDNTGYQAFVNGKGWEKLEIKGPNGVIAEIQGSGMIKDLGMTEVLIETPEMESAKMPREELLKMLPQGQYEFRAAASKLGGGTGQMIGIASLSHTIPEGVSLAEPKTDVSVPKGNITFRWSPSLKALDGAAIDLAGYQLVIDNESAPVSRMIAKRGMSMFLPASVTEVTIPAAFFEAGADYGWEVLAIDASGNQTLTSSTFKTQ
jgi:hypothetical protein